MNVSVGHRFVVVKVLDCDIVVSEFELLSRYYVDFRTDTFKKNMNLFIMRAID